MPVGLFKWLAFTFVVAAHADLTAKPLVLRGGATPAQPEQYKTGKTWTTASFTRDHVRFMKETPSYLGAYINPFSRLDPKTIESVMVTMNSINTCPYCTGLHGQLARMADAPVNAKTPAVKFATTFAQEGGRGAKVVSAFDDLVASEGRGRAVNVRALCWALLWGKTTGNSINTVRNKLLSGRLLSITPFDLIMFTLYGPLFVVIALFNAMLTVMPQVPPQLHTLIGVFLWVPQALHFLPIGLVCLALRVLAAPFGGLDL